MSRESESEQTQRTVAELLAQYGGGSGDPQPRRRRRRAEDASDTAPQTIIDRVNSDSGRLLPIRDEPPPSSPPPPPPPPAAPPPGSLPQRRRRPDPERTTFAAPVRPEPAPVPAEPLRTDPLRTDPLPRPDNRAEATRADLTPPPVPPASSRLDPFGEASARPDPLSARLDPSRSDLPRPDPRRRGVPDVDAAEETRVVPPIRDADYDEFLGEQSRPNLPKPAEPTRANLRPPPPPPPPVREPVTEVLPRIEDKLKPNVPLESLPTESVLIVPPAPPRLPDPLPGQAPEDWFGDDDEPGGGAPAGESTQFHPYVDLDDEEADRDDDYELPRREFADEGPAGLADVDEDVELDDEPVRRSPGKEWLVMIGQLAIGVVGGAALWLGFSFLWRTLAPAALVVALAVTVGLVLVVRKIRRADDLQTTVLAVLVGLIVTVSPAAMLLVKS
ncbi:hypothetical protein [Actinosynnema sp. NPDC020468]|uniref:hypothetical protein n=1 Tax=Actinosynnema sp. NPDC020468 TaxID=3154488 RepID=UPI0033FD566E